MRPTTAKPPPANGLATTVSPGRGMMPVRGGDVYLMSHQNRGACLRPGGEEGVDGGRALSLFAGFSKK